MSVPNYTRQIVVLDRNGLARLVYRLFDVEHSEHGCYRDPHRVFGVSVPGADSKSTQTLITLMRRQSPDGR